MLYLINGAPRSGKDTVAEILSQRLGCKTRKLARELKERAHAMYGSGFAHDYFERTKDKPEPFFLGLTPREVYIRFHEQYLKPVHGPEILGRLLIDREDRDARLMRTVPIWQQPIGVSISDAGQREQCLPLVRAWGAENVILIRLHREGVSWNDNREPINLTDLGVRMVHLTNPGDTIENLNKAVRAILPDLLDSSTPVSSA